MGISAHAPARHPSSVKVYVVLARAGETTDHNIWQVPDVRAMPDIREVLGTRRRDTLKSNVRVDEDLPRALIEGVALVRLNVDVAQRLVEDIATFDVLLNDKELIHGPVEVVPGCSLCQ